MATATITELNKAPVLIPYRKVEIKRRLNDGTGGYESDWYDITDTIKSFGVVSWKIDTDTMGVFTQSTLTLTGDNLSRSWDVPTETARIFSGYLTRYKTLFKITTGLYDGQNIVPSGGGAVFYGILTDDVILTDTEATITVNSLTQIFREQSASALSFASDTASDIVNKILNLQDSVS